MSESGSKGATAFLSTISGLVVGGAIGYFMASRSNKKEGGGGIKSRSIDFIEYSDGNEMPLMASPRSIGYNASTDASVTTHINFLSDIMNRLWPKINIAGSKLMRETMEPMFANSLPSMLKSLKFSKLDLGHVPIVIDNILVHELQIHPDTGMEYIQWDWDVSWNSSSNIELSTSNNMVKLGVKSIQLNGRMSFWMQTLSEEIPCFDAIHYAFVNPPHIDLDFTGLANVGDFSSIGVDIKGMIRTMMKDVISSIMVLPVKMTYVINPVTDFRDMYTSSILGLARIRAHSGRGFQPQKRTLRSHDVPDVYLKIKLGREQPWKTKTIHNELNPKWDHTTEYHDFLLCSKEQVIVIEAHDEDKGAMDGDDFLGKATVTVGQVLLLASGAHKTLEVELVKEERKGSIQLTGCFVTISLSILPFTTKDLSSLNDNANEKDKTANRVAGLLTVLIQQAFDLPVEKKDAASFVKVWYGAKQIGVTSVVTDQPGYDALNPLYQVPFHFSLTVAELDKTEKASVKLQLLNQATELLGEISIPHDKIVKAANATVRETAKIGTKGASLAFSVSLAGVSKNVLEVTAATASSCGPTADVTASTSYSPTTEIIQVSITKAYGFKIRIMGPFKRKDIPDVYCILRFASNPEVWRTSTVKDSVVPVWKNETRQFPLQSANQVISIDVFEANSKTKDEFYGNARTSVGKILLNGGSMDLEVIQSNKNTGIYITVHCQKL
ncbi:C2 domain containing protein [Nitzschia inconspicua]|uniref:C2 domain containing protein n=1 Tax=Nitzschia inconspicua TaxID=303405 RepID=A0A9K3M3L7_9STRA|nr:C2 domain containing protein [Nitzschia inconspicua]